MLSDEALPMEVWREQSNNKSLPGLLRETEEHISAMGFTLNDLVGMSKKFFQKKAKEYIKNKNKSELVERARSYKKLDFRVLSEEDFCRKPYFFNQTLETGRMLFRVSANLVQGIKANYPSKYRRMKRPLSCSVCPPVNSSMDSSTTESGHPEPTSRPLHSQSHILRDCVEVEDLRSECDPLDEKSLAQFFLRVTARRLELEKLL